MGKGWSGGLCFMEPLCMHIGDGAGLWDEVLPTPGYPSSGCWGGSVPTSAICHFSTQNLTALCSHLAFSHPNPLLRQ